MLRSFFVAVSVLIVAIVSVGCTPDKSGDTQTMPAGSKASAPNVSPSMSTLPPAAQKAIQQAAPPR